MDGPIKLYEQEPLLRAAGDTLRPGHLTLTRRLLEACDLPPGAVVLDIGCGLGATVEVLSAQYRAFGLDISAKLLARGRSARPALSLVRAAGELLPFADQTLDAVFCECCLSIVSSADSVLDECARALKPGGRLVISDLYARDPAGAADLRCLPFVSCLRGAMTQDDLFTRLGQHGFDVILWEDQTNALKAFTAQLLFAHGSIEQFWCSALGAANADPAQVRRAVAQSKPGYFILIAQRSTPNG